MDRKRIDEGFARTGHTLVPLVWELARVVGEPHGGWVHWGATTQNITQTGDLLVLRAGARDLPAPDRRDPGRHGRPRRTHGRHADGRPHPWPARGARDLRLQGRGLDRRIAAPRRATAPGGPAPVRRHAGRRRRHLRLARQAGSAGAGRHRPPTRLRPMTVPSRALGRSPGGEHLHPRSARCHRRQDRARDLHVDEDRVRRGRGAGAAGHRRQLDHAAEAQSRKLCQDVIAPPPRCAAWCRWRSRP